MKPRYLVNIVQAGGDYNVDLFKDLPWFLACHPRELAKLVSEFYQHTTIENTADRPRLRAISEAYHRRMGTLTVNVIENLQRFEDGAPVIRIAHTPDFFGYLSIYVAMFYICEVARILKKEFGIKASIVFLLIDSDVASDKRLRSCSIPDVDREFGRLFLNAPVPDHCSSIPVATVQGPSSQTVDLWMDKLHAFIKHNLAILYRQGIPLHRKYTIWEHYNKVKEELYEALKVSESLSDFNTAFLSRILNVEWNMPISFFPQTDVAPVLVGHYRTILSKYGSIISASKEVVRDLRKRGLQIKDNLEMDSESFPFWLLCKTCHGRISLRSTSDNEWNVEGNCNICGRLIKWKVGQKESPFLDESPGLLIPKVMFDTITDFLAWGMIGGVSYVGSAEHVLVNNLVAIKLGFRVPPESLVQCRGIHYGFTEARIAISAKPTECRLPERWFRALQRAYSGRASVLYYFIAQGIGGVERMWRIFFEEGHSYQELNIGDSAFSLDESQCNMLIKCVKKFDNAS